jgi:O-antigen/teichoic acid export membrane protein
MKYQQKLEATIKLAEYQATWVLWIGAALALAFIAVFLWGWLNRNNEDRNGLAEVVMITSAVLFFIPVVVLFDGLYNLKTARLRAEATTADYNMVEVIKE